MNHVAMLKKYLQGRAEMDLAEQAFPFVTISRQAGAGGHALARDIVRLVEQRLPEPYATGWEVFDHKLCLLIAEDPELSAQFDHLLAEEYRSESSQMISDLISGEARQYKIFKRIFQIVYGLARVGRVVIVGRAGNCVTSNLCLGVRLRLVAGEASRVRRMAQLLDLSPDRAAHEMRKQDAERAKLLYDFFGKNIDDPLQYDAVLNTDEMSFDEMAEVACALLKRRLSKGA